MSDHSFQPSGQILDIFTGICHVQNVAVCLLGTLWGLRYVECREVYSDCIINVSFNEVRTLTLLDDDWCFLFGIFFSFYLLTLLKMLSTQI